MQAIYVPKYKIYYRVSPKEPNVLQWSAKPFGPATQWQTAMRFGKPIRALDTDDVTGQGVVVLNDSSTYVGSGVRVWGRKFYPAGTRIYSLYAVGEKKMKAQNKLNLRIHEASDAPHWNAGNIDNYVQSLWNEDIVKEVISTKYPDYPEITWKLYDSNGYLVTIVSLAQDMLHIMRPGHYYSKSLTGWGCAFWQGNQLENIKRVFDDFEVYTYTPKVGQQPKKQESKKTETLASQEDIDKIESYLRTHMVGNVYGKNSVHPERDIESKINDLLRNGPIHTLSGASDEYVDMDVELSDALDLDTDDVELENLPSETNAAYTYDAGKYSPFLLFTVDMFVEKLDNWEGAKVTKLNISMGD